MYKHIPLTGLAILNYVLDVLTFFEIVEWAWDGLGWPQSHDNRTQRKGHSIVAALLLSVSAFSHITDGGGASAAHRQQNTADSCMELCVSENGSPYFMSFTNMTTLQGIIMTPHFQLSHLISWILSDVLNNAHLKSCKLSYLYWSPSNVIM